ncbi:MAG: sigma-70 family RNA polymerase sigma factor [Acidimicrobiia bacterium]
MPFEDITNVADPDLVAAVGCDDEAAMADLMRRHRAPVVAFARRLVGDHARAEEVSQDVFLRLWEKWDRYDPAVGSVRAFLLAITHGRTIDVVRSDHARARREERDAWRTAVPAPGPDALVVAAGTAATLRGALLQLPDVERDAVELAYFGGHSYRKVATMLGEPEGTVKSRIRSGLARLREALAAQDL